MDAREARDCWSRASLHVPDATSWGFYFLPDFPQESHEMPFMPGFLWFSDRKEVMEFLAKIVPATFQEVYGVVRSDLEACEGLVDDFMAREGEPDAAAWKSFRENLNKVLKGLLLVPWIGTFGELTDSDGFFPKYARLIFRMERKLNVGNDIKKDYSPVCPEQRPMFLDFILNWDKCA